MDESKFWELEKQYNLMLDNENYDDLMKFADEYRGIGYAQAIDDVQAAMKLAEVVESQPTFSGEIILNTYNHPAKFVEELRRLRQAHGL